MLPSRGRPGLALVMSVKRPLTPGDLLRLQTDPDLPISAAPILKRLRAIHHQAAQLLAAGKSIKETAFAVGQTPQSIGDRARSDPAFKELVSYYQNQRTDAVIDTTNRVQQKLIDVAELAVDEITDRLEDPAKLNALPVSELRQLATMGLDRTVAPPKTAQPATIMPTQITFNVGTRDIRPKTIEGEALILDTSSESEFPAPNPSPETPKKGKT